MQPLCVRAEQVTAAGQANASCHCHPTNSTPLALSYGIRGLSCWCHTACCPAGATLPVDDSKELARVGPGQCFGELALLSGDGRAANVIALDTSLVRARNAS